MKQNWDISRRETLKHEGGYVNHPDDPGGHTNLGITLRTLRRWEPTATVADLKALEPDSKMVSDIYHAGYWQPCRCDELPSGVDYVVYDAAVNSGPRRSIKLLQQALGVDDDGVLGPITMDAVWKQPPASIINQAVDRRLAFWKSLKIWNTFGRGWSRRGAAVRAFALGLVSKTPHPKQPTPTDRTLGNPIWQWLVPLIGMGVAAFLKVLGVL